MGKIASTRDMTYSHKTVVGKREGKRPLRRPIHRCEENEKRDLNEGRCEDVH